MSAVPRPKKLKRLAPKQRGALKEYSFHTASGGQSTDRVLMQLQLDGWVVQSSSDNGKGGTVLLLKRAKALKPVG